MPKISFVILTYNSQAYISDLLKSILNFYEKNIEIGDAEILVVDNNSQDRTREIVEKFKEVKLIQNRENLGFSKGINLGVEKAKGEFIVILNPDMKLLGGNIYDAIGNFEKDSRIGVIGGRIKNKKGFEKSSGRFIKSFEVFLMSLGLDEVLGLRNSPRKTQEIDFVSGGFMIVRKDLFKKLSGFDESFFMYVEDMEFCYRVKKEGFKVIFDPHIEVEHFVHGSSDRSFAIRNIHKGLVLFHKKHGSILSKIMVPLFLSSKSASLVIIGKILNNKYLTRTYSKALNK